MPNNASQPHSTLLESDAALDLSAGTGRYEWHVSDDRLVWSTGLCAIYGRAHPPSGESEFSRLVHHEDRVRVEAETAGFLSSSNLAYSHFYRILRPDGDVRFILDRGVIERDKHGRAIRLRGLNVDLTGLHEVRPKPVDEAVVERFAELEALYAQAPLGLGLLDQDLRFVRINPALAEINGFSVQEHLNRSAWDLLPDLRETAEPALKQVLATGLPLRNVLVTGETASRPGVVRAWREHFYPLRGSNGRVQGIVVVCEEVTEGLAAERRLSASEARFRQMADNAPMMVWVTQPDGACTYLNKAWYDFTGQSPDHAAGFGWLEAVHPDDAAHSERVFREANASQRDFRLEYRLRRADGVYRWAIDSARAHRDANGDFQGFIGSVIDITERKEAEVLKAYLLKLSDALRPLRSPTRIQAAAARLLGEALGANRTAYFVIDSDAYNVVAEHAVGAPSILGQHPIATFGRAVIDADARGKPVVVSDVSLSHSKAETEKFAEIQVAAYIGVSLAKDGHSVAGFTVHSPTPRAWTDAELRMTVETTERTWAAVEWARAEQKRLEGEARYRVLFEAIDEGFCVVEVRVAPDEPIDYRVIEANPAFYRQTGFPEAILGSWLREALPELEEHWYELYGRVAITGEPARFERQSNALGRWFDVYAFRLGSAAERRVAILFSDISDRKQQEERMQLVMQEANHRAKNTLALVSAIARQTAASQREDFIGRFSARVQALAASQDLLIQSEWKGAELEALVVSQLTHFKELMGNQITLSGEALFVGSRATQTLSMALHELATNSAKYGALSCPEGHVHVSWSTAEVSGSQQLLISWRESGGPTVLAPTRKGFGHRVVKTMVERSLSGKVTLEYASTGLVWSLRCPVEAIHKS